MDAKWRWILISTGALLAIDSQAFSMGSTNSFAETFFVSRKHDGSLEYIGSAVTWLLLLLSMCSIGLMIHLSLANRRSTLLPDELISAIRKNIRKKQFQAAIDLASKDQSYVGKILLAAFKEAKFGYASMIRALEQTADELATARMRKIELLNVVGQVSPMIGLFGTVYGMIIAFGAIVAAGGSADPVALAGGIGTALTTTFWGLIVAIPALAGYAIIRNRIDELTVEATIAAEDMIHHFRPHSSSRTKVHEQRNPNGENGAQLPAQLLEVN